jgi:hypothetical protein
MQQLPHHDCPHESDEKIPASAYGCQFAPKVSRCSFFTRGSVDNNIIVDPRDVLAVKPVKV